MKLRNMTINDYDSVYEIWINTPGMGLNNLDDSREGIEKYLNRNPSTCFVAEEEGQIIGSIIAGHDGRRGYVSHTVVKEEYQRRGIGKALVTAMMEAMKTEGIHKVALVVFERNKKGNSFWEKEEFTTRSDIIYRNKCIDEMIRYDT